MIFMSTCILWIKGLFEYRFIVWDKYKQQKRRPFSDIHPISGMLSESQTCSRLHITHQIKIYVLISQPHQTIAVALTLTCLNVQSKQTSTNSTAVLLKPSHYFLLWNRAGFLRMLPACNPLGGNIMGSKLQAMVTGFYLYCSTLSDMTPGTHVCKAHISEQQFKSEHDKGASEVNKGGCSC